LSRGNISEILKNATGAQIIGQNSDSYNLPIYPQFYTDVKSQKFDVSLAFEVVLFRKAATYLKCMFSLNLVQFSFRITEN